MCKVSPPGENHGFTFLSAMEKNEEVNSFCSSLSELFREAMVRSRFELLQNITKSSA